MMQSFFEYQALIIQCINLCVIVSKGYIFDKVITTDNSVKIEKLIVE
jgi:hypothetical protein